MEISGIYKIRNKKTNQVYIGSSKSFKFRKRNKHPAPFPLELAVDHVLSWTNEGDIVLDPMNGSGTTCVAAKQNKRNYIGIDVSTEYCQIAEKRLNAS